MDTWYEYVKNIHDNSSRYVWNDYCRLLTYWGEILDPDGLYKGDFAKSEKVRRRIITLLTHLRQAGYSDLELAQAGMVRGVGCIADMLGQIE